MSWLLGPGAAVSWHIQELLCLGGWVQELQCPINYRSFSILVTESRSCSVLLNPGA